MTAAFHISYLYVALSVAGVLVTGVCVLCRGYGICSRDTLREVMLWGGGFIIYSIFDYLILLR